LNDIIRVVRPMLAHCRRTTSALMVVCQRCTRTGSRVITLRYSASVMGDEWVTVVLYPPVTCDTPRSYFISGGGNYRWQMAPAVACWLRGAIYRNFYVPFPPSGQSCRHAGWSPAWPRASPVRASAIPPPRATPPVPPMHYPHVTQKPVWPLITHRAEHGASFVTHTRRQVFRSLDPACSQTRRSGRAGWSPPSRRGSPVGVIHTCVWHHSSPSGQPRRGFYEL